MSLATDHKKIEQQERALRFARFSENDAWELGLQMRNAAAKRGLPIVIDIRMGTRQLFFAALPGTAPDNSEWIRRKANTVQRYHMASYRKGRELAMKGRALDASRGVSEMDYAKDGGGFPIHIEGTGVVGCVTVSGIPERDDHGFAVEQIAIFLGKNAKALALGPERK